MQFSSTNYFCLIDRPLHLKNNMGGFAVQPSTGIKTYSDYPLWEKVQIAFIAQFRETINSIVFYFLLRFAIKMG